MGTEKTKKQLSEKERHWEFNEGRLNCDGKWSDAIDERIRELEKQVGIPELRRLKKETKYRWRNTH